MRSRKGKDCIEERKFICGCGKSYLSQPALYQHTKIKHQGIKQDGSKLLEETEKIVEVSK